ncbi:MAG TPA: PTS sugar transporter subunit IIA [Phycisphaeraceae bacterium]
MTMVSKVNSMKLQDFVVIEATIPDLQPTERDEVIRELVDALVRAGAAPQDLRDDLIKMIIDREKHGSTGFGKGVAVPHVKHERIKRMVATIGVSQKGVDFNALDKAPVYSVVLLLSPKDKPDEHLQAMENIFSNLQKDTFRRFLRQVTSQKDIQELILEADAQQLA